MTKFFEITFRAEVDEKDVEKIKALEGQATDGFEPFPPLEKGARLWHLTVEELDPDRYTPHLD